MDPRLWPLAAVFLPLLSAALVPVLEHKWLKGRAETMTALACALTVMAVVLCAPGVIGAKAVLRVALGGDMGLGDMPVLAVDSLGLFMGGIASTLWFLCSVFAMGYMAGEHARPRFCAFSLLALCGMMGTVFAGNLITLLFFFELLTFSSYVLVIHEQTHEAWQAGLLYIFLGIFAGLCLLFSITGTYVAVGSVDLTRIGAGLGNSPLKPWIFWGFVIGFGVKAGLFPVHIWLPKAHPIAPSPASALLSGVMIKAGAFGIIRILFSIWGTRELMAPIMGMVSALMVLALIGIFLGSAVAMAQTDIKSLLAYSSIGQIGYVILGVTLLNPLGLRGGLIHIFNHALIKGCLFLCAGIFIKRTGKRKLGDLVGIGRELPVTTFCFTVAALSMIGIPPLNGFVSKWFLALGCLESGGIGFHEPAWGYAALGTLLLSSLMNLIYYGPILYGAWFGASDPGHGGHGKSSGHKDSETVKVLDPGWTMLAPVILLTAGIVFFGIYPLWPLALAKRIVTGLFGGLL